MSNVMFYRFGQKVRLPAKLLRYNNFFVCPHDPFSGPRNNFSPSETIAPGMFRYQHSSPKNGEIIGSSRNDLAENHEIQAKTSDKLRDVLNGIGMSISQWKIQDSKAAADNKELLSLVNKGGLRHKHSSQNAMKKNLQLFNGQDLSNGNRYLYKHSRRVNEEFDVYNNHYVGGHSARRRKKFWVRGDHDISARLRVKSIHAASQINITKVLTTVFGPDTETPAIRHMYGKTKIIVEIPPAMAKTNDTQGDAADARLKADDFFHSEKSQPQPRFVAVFRFGSVVFFNVSPKDVGILMESIKNYSTDPIPKPFERKERFEIAISPHMQETAHVNADFATVKELNIDNVAIVSTIMGQTVAFDSYNDMVDELLATFASINSTVNRTGNFTAMEKETLFKVVAQNNSLFIDIIAKLGIKDRSETAWNMSQYERLYDGMRNEFEIESRFDRIEYKLNLIQQNAKFFLDILQNQKSDLLEWIIIVLISFECVLMILDMTGVGPQLLPQF
jgi:uncharacterized Rmd1/YagE family protein